MENSRACDEERLLDGANRFDLAILAQIHACFYKLLYRYAHYRTNDVQAAQDIAGEVFVRLLDALQGEHPPRRSLRGWLFGTASHIVNDYFRHHYRHEDQDLEHELLPDSVNNSPEHQFDLNLSHERLRAALTQLTPDQQQVITLRFGQGLSHRQTALMLGKSEGAVKLLQLRALRALRSMLEPA